MVLARGIAGFLFPRLLVCMYMSSCVGTQGSQSRREQGLLAVGILSVRAGRGTCMVTPAMEGELG